MYRFLRSPKWLFGHALVLLVIVTFSNFGFWQLRRLDEVRTHNALVAERLEVAPVPLTQALAADEPYRRVEAAGEYVPEAQLLTAPRSRGGTPGQHVLTPLETADGAVLVDRGWVPFERDDLPAEALAPPDGQVQVSGLLMPAEAGRPGEAEALLSIIPEEVTERTGVPLAPGYLQLQQTRPTTDGGPLPHADPVLEEGNHLSYAVQWFLFTAVVAVGYPLLMWRTGREQPGGGPGPPTEAAVAYDPRIDEPAPDRGR